MVSFPHCKINLGLNVIAKRSDGFHNIETCFYPLPLTDILEIIPAPEFSFAQSGTEVPGEKDDNLCLKAYQLIKNDFAIRPIKIHLHKIIPIGAGLGGGSADAVFTLRLLASIFELPISNEQLKTYAVKLGSDCSFFVEDAPMIGRGRGEILSPASVSLNGYYLVLVKPDLHVSTVEAYAGLGPRKSSISIGEILKLSVDEWRGRLENDFEKSIFAKYPLISEIKEKMYAYGAVYASMTGSGSSVFGIFKMPVDLRAEFSGSYCWSGELK